eukprot:GHVU01030999.1.p1 GENE.GHVU01030999.1~~GHVU01030999.1.p1  ORF type:complete len:105 (+),score=21.01 GHVU01030999.1:31-315(+)
MYDVERISDITYNLAAKRWECRVAWLGFEEADSTPEPLREMVKDVPQFVLEAMKESTTKPTPELQRQIWDWMPDANWKERCQKVIEELGAEGAT